jgi:lycopene beta-cyclase
VRFSKHETPANGVGVTRSSHLIVGGGLAGGLAALALADEGRGPEVTLVEGGTALGGDVDHTWSCHESDLDQDVRGLVMPLVAHRWPAQIVRFPGRERQLETGYLTVTGERFARFGRERLERSGARLVFGARAVEVGERHVRLADGRVLEAEMVLDARGSEPDAGGGRGYQKFVGLELALADDGPWELPVVMDASVEQSEGFRFVYVLPFSRRRVLVEETVYSEDALVDADAYSRRVAAYVEASGARVDRVLRREIGVLPLPLADEKKADEERGGPLAIGYRGRFFHGVTGYSLPEAARVARTVSRTQTREEAARALMTLSQARAGQRRFQRLLARLLFRALPPATRWTALDRFYRLPDETIARFYASRSTAFDRARMLVGRPPAGMSWRRLLGAAREAA